MPRRAKADGPPNRAARYEFHQFIDATLHERLERICQHANRANRAAGSPMRHTVARIREIGLEQFALAYEKQHKLKPRP